MSGSCADLADQRCGLVSEVVTGVAPPPRRGVVERGCGAPCDEVVDDLDVGAGADQAIPASRRLDAPGSEDATQSRDLGVQRRAG